MLKINKTNALYLLLNGLIFMFILVLMNSYLCYYKTMNRFHTANVIYSSHTRGEIDELYKDDEVFNNVMNKYIKMELEIFTEGDNNKENTDVYDRNIELANRISENKYFLSIYHSELNKYKSKDKKESLILNVFALLVFLLFTVLFRYRTKEK